MPETIIYVSTSTELKAALSTATGGETIYLREGDYGAIGLSDLHFDSMVTIASEVPLGAMFSDITIKSSDNLRFDGIEVEKILESDQPHWTKSIQITGSNNIEIINSDIHGSEDGIYDNDGYLIYVRTSSDILISNNTIHEAMRAGVFDNSDSVVISNNSIYNIRSDAFDFIGVVDLTISDNSFTNFHPRAGDHADAIQFFNNGSPRGSGNVDITGNTFLQGEGEAFQSMFISDSQGMPYYNFNITGNLIYNSSSHGITMQGGSDVLISNNTVLQSVGGQYAPRIQVSGSTGIVEVSNNASKLSLEVSDFVIATNNIEAQNSHSDLPTYYGNLFFDAFSGASATIEDFIPRPGGLLDSGTIIGAYSYSAITDTLQAQAVSETYHGTSESLKVTFDGSDTTDIDGNPGETGVTYQWDFGDGTSGEGILVNHTYSQEGDYAAVLTVTRDGRSDSTTHTVTAVDPHVLQITGAGSSAIKSLAANMTSTDDTLQFDGNGIVNLGRPGELFDLDEMYVSLDINPTAFSSDHAVLLHSHMRYSIAIKGDVLTFKIYTDGVANKFTVSNIDVFDGQFHNIAMSFDSATGTIKAFVDNIEVGLLSGVTGSIEDSASWDVVLGGTPWGNNFTGEIDNVNFWSAPEPVEAATISTTTVIDTITTTTDPVVADTTTTTTDTTTTTTDPVVADTTTTTTTEPVLDTTTTTTDTTTTTSEPVLVQDTTTTTTDTTTTDTTLTYETNMVLSIADSTDTAGYTAVGNAVIGADALIFNGKGYVDLGQDANLFGLDAFTLSFDITAGTAKNDNKGVVRLVWNQEQYGIEMKGEDLIFRILTDTGDTPVLTIPGAGVNDGGSHTVVMSYDSATGILSGYVDNVLVGETSGITGSIADANGGSVTIGGGDRGRNFEGEIDNLTMWSDADHTPDATYSSASLTVVDTAATDTSTTTIIDSTEPSLTTDTTTTPDGTLYNPDEFFDISLKDSSLL